MSYQTTAESFRQQVEDQKAQVENLKTALLKLQQKLAEARIQERRADRPAPPLARPGQGHRRRPGHGRRSNSAAFDRMKNKVQHTEATAQARAELLADDVETGSRRSKSRRRSTVCWKRSNPSGRPDEARRRQARAVCLLISWSDDDLQSEGGRVAGGGDPAGVGGLDLGELLRARPPAAVTSCTIGSPRSSVRQISPRS